MLSLKDKGVDMHAALLLPIIEHAANTGDEQRALATVVVMREQVCLWSSA